MTGQSITLIPIGYFEKEFLEKVANAIRQELPCPVQIRDGHLDTSEYFDPARKQYDGNRLLRAVDSMVPADSAKGIGVFSIDLYIPILTFIFGQAYLGGRAGIASLFRLRNERYGLPGDDELLFQRLVKEVVHELGHTFGLIHCHVPTCVMRSSTYVEEIDQKDPHYCHSCRSILEETVFQASN